METENGTKLVSSWRELERSSPTIKKAEVLKIPLEEIHVKEGFNPRDSSKPETRKKIVAIKESFKAGRYVPPIECSLEDGVVYIVDGHGRFEAANLANQELEAEGAEHRIDSMIVVPFRGNDAQRLVLTITANEGEKLIPVEAAEVVSRLLNMGWEKQKIMETFSWSMSWVDKLAFISGLPERIKQLLKQEKVSTDVVVSTFKDKKKTEKAAVDYIEALVEKAEQKVTTKHVKPKKPMVEDVGFLNKIFERVQVATEDLGLDKEAYPMGIKDEEDYEVCLKGSTLKALVDLQETVKRRAEKQEEATS